MKQFTQSYVTNFVKSVHFVHELAKILEIFPPSTFL